MKKIFSLKILEEASKNKLLQLKFLDRADMRLFTKKVGLGWFKRGPLNQYVKCGCHAYLLIWLKSRGERGASSHHPTFRHTFCSPIVVVI